MLEHTSVMMRTISRSYCADVIGIMGWRAGLGTESKALYGGGEFGCVGRGCGRTFLS